MNREKLVKIINKELTTLTEIIGDFSTDGQIEPFELDLALSKMKDLEHVIHLLKNQETNQQPAKPVNEPELIPEVKPILNTLEVSDTLPITKTPEPEIPSEEPLKTNEIPMEFNPEEPIAQPEPAVEKEIIPVISIVTEEIEPIIEVAEIKTEEVIEQKTIVPVPPKSIPVEVSEEKPVVQKNSKSTSTIIADTFVTPSSSVNERMAAVKKQKDLASTIKDRPVKNLKSAIKLNDRIWFTNELFQKDAALFEKTVDVLNQSADLDAALSHVFTHFNWDQNQKSTIQFLELVFRRFSK